MATATQKFFHAKSVWCARKNRIKKLEDINGVIHTDSKAMGAAATRYFENIFTAESNLDCSPIIDLISPLVGEDRNDMLCGEFTEKEISATLFQIGPLKAPGADGSLHTFFNRTGLR